MAEPSLCLCQCMAVEVLSSTCIRYMPQFCVRAPGSLVKTSGRVKKRPAVLRPAVEHRQRREVGLPLDHLLAGRAGKAQAAPVGKAGGEAPETRGEAMRFPREV